MQLCQALAKSRIGSMGTRERKPRKDLKQKSVSMMPARIKEHITECMTKICARYGPIAITWDMASRACIFAMNGNGHMLKILQLFPPAQKLRGATVSDLEEERTLKYRTRTEVEFNAYLRLFNTLRTLVQFISAVSLTNGEVDECRNMIMDLLLRADELIAPKKVLLEVKSTLTWHHHAICTRAT